MSKDKVANKTHYSQNQTQNQTQEQDGLLNLFKKLNSNPQAQQAMAQALKEMREQEDD